MGHIVVEIPQEVNKTYKFESEELGEQLLESVENLAEQSDAQASAILPPRRDSLEADTDEVLGIWSDRPESADEIARKIRSLNNGIK